MQPTDTILFINPHFYIHSYINIILIKCLLNQSNISTIANFAIFFFLQIRTDINNTLNV